MAELFIGAFIDTVIDKTVPWFGQYLMDWVRGKGNNDPMKEWSVTLQRIRNVLEDAEKKQVKNRDVRRWLDKLYDLAYDIEDVVDELDIEAQSTTFVAEVMTSAASLFNGKIEDISRRLEDISEGITKLGLNSNVVGEMGVVLSSPKTSSHPPSRVIGREKEKKEIVEMLMKPEAEAVEIPVITILGMGGIGKTTLVQDVYNDKEVQGCFDLRAWVCVSDVFDVTNITRAILIEITGQDYMEKLELNGLQGKLKEMLSGKKFLLVLDDIWNEDYLKWENLLLPFPSGAAAVRSRILTTTRSEYVASTMSLTRSWYYLRVLGDRDCLSLLASHALGRDDFDLHPDLKESGKKIVKKCGHLPSAIKMVAGLLRRKPQLQCEWEAVINSNEWAKASDRILLALRVSYYHLSSDLKRCFAYCSIIPKDYIFDKNDLVLLWMAEGLLEQPAGGMEDFGRDCFQDLLSRSFFQLTPGGESKFIMHDLINDLAVDVAGERCFRIDDAWDRNRKYEISERTRYLSFISQNYEVSKKLNIFNKARRSRTFLPLPLHSFPRYFGMLTSDADFAFMLSPLQLLRVLNLEGCEIVELPNPVGAMKHLRYLNLSYTPIAQLPPFVCSLYNLQTLLLNGWQSLCELPSSISCLTNLRHLGLEDTPKLEKMPSGIGKLTSLQSLSKIIVGKDKGSCNLKDLEGLIHLHGTLSIEELQNVTDVEDAVAADLRSKEHLEVLELRWCFTDSVSTAGRRLLEKRMLGKLQPHCNLEVLEIEGYGGFEFPSWVGRQSLPRLRVLKIGHCRELGKLPSGLYDLSSLLEMSIIDCPSLIWDGLRWLPKSLIVLEFRNCPKSVLSYWGFRRLTSLQTLSILGLEDVVSLKLLEDSNWGGAPTSYLFPPSLTYLRIGSLPKLKSLSNSLQNLTSLKVLFISDCPKLESLAGADDDEASLQIIRSLLQLRINGCSKVLIEHCEKEKGKYWPTIQHIQRLDIRLHFKSTVIN